MSAELDRESEVQLMAQFHAGDQAARARLVAVGTMILLAAAADTRRRPDQWDDAAQQLILKLLEKPASVLKAFHPTRVSLRAYLLGRVRQRIGVMRRSDLRFHEREQDAWAIRTALHAGRQVDWDTITEPVWPDLTPAERIYTQGALDALAARKRAALSDTAERSFSEGAVQQGSSKIAARQLKCRIRRKAAAAWDGAAGEKK